MRAISSSRTERLRTGDAQISLPRPRPSARASAAVKAGSTRRSSSSVWASKLLALAAAPDPDVADVAVADIAVGIDAPVQAVAGEKIVEELGPHQIALRHHLGDQRRLAPRLQLEGDGIVVLEIAVVGREVGRVHVEEHGLVEAARAFLPDKGGVVVGLQQFEQMMADRLAHVVFAEVFGQQPEDPRQHPALCGGDIHGGPILAGNRVSEWERDSRANRFEAPRYSVLMPASLMTLRQRASSPRK